MKNSYVKSIALGGILAALAMVVMCLGGLIPVATYVCPTLCVVLLHVVLTFCGKRIAWAWYCAVSFLSVLMSPDKEAPLIYLFVGFYPLLKPFFDKRILSWLWKILFFNTMILLSYNILILVLGMAQLGESFSELGTIMMIIFAIMGNVIFIMLDIILTRINIKTGRY